MTTTPGSDERSGDGAVHSLLWRLRARLVTPPTEERVRSDLDRLLAAAHEQAHLTASADATAAPDVDAAASRPDTPLVAVSTGPIASGGDDEAAAPIDELALRRGRDARGFAAVLTRFAAAGVAILVVGTGVSAATDGQVSLNAMFARDAAPMPQASDGSDDTTVAAPVDDGDTVVDADGADVADPPAPPDVAAPDEDVEVAVPDDVDGEADDGAADGSPAQDNDAPDTSGTPDDAGSTGTSGSGSSPDGGSSGPSDDAASESDAPTSGADGSESDGSGSDAPASEPDEPASEPDEQIIAAPPSSGVDGFGGTRCEEDELTECLDDEGDEPSGDEDDVAADGDQPASDEGDPDTDPGDDLASRRFQPDPATSTDDTTATP